jgi:hypothetical protein
MLRAIAFVAQMDDLAPSAPAGHVLDANDPVSRVIKSKRKRGIAKNYVNGLAEKLHFE